MSVSIDHIKKVKQTYEKQWLAQQGVVAVGIGRINSQPGIVVSVEKPSDLKRVHIHEVIEGVPIKVQVGGRFTAQS